MKLGPYIYPLRDYIGYSFPHSLLRTSQIWGFKGLRIWGFRVDVGFTVWG